MRDPLFSDWAYRQFWRVARKVYRATNIEGVEFVDVCAEKVSDRVTQTLAGAMHVLDEVGGGFDQLVRHELEFVAATDMQLQVSERLRAYMSPFSGRERQDSDFLAARLVWAAAYLQEARTARGAEAPFDMSQVNEYALERRRAFERRRASAYQ